MPAIIHYLEMNCDVFDVFDAITQQKGLRNWWTQDALAKPEPDTIISVFGANGFKLKIEKLETPEKVRWICIDGPTDWLQTKIHFDISMEKEQTTRLYFKHSGWSELSKTMSLCSFDWAIYLNALRAYAESGEAQVGDGALRLSTRWQ